MNNMAKRINMKQLLHDKEKAKGFFASKGYANVKRTFIDENGEQQEEIISIEIKPLGDHPLKKAFLEKNPMPKPPVIRELINVNTGETAYEAGVTIDAIKNDPNWQWKQIQDETDEKYQKELQEWQRKFLAIQMMIVFEVEDEFGIEKIDEFEQFLEDLGLSANQVQNIAEAIRDLDFLESNKKNRK